MMESFKEYLAEGWFGFGKKKSEQAKSPEPEKRSGGPYGGPHHQRHNDPDGPVATMHTATLHKAYDKLRNTKGAGNSSRYKELEKERNNRGHKARTHIDFWDNYQKVKPKPVIHWKDADGKQYHGG